jgi:hypothetical protein
MRAQRPVTLSIGPFGALSMKLFATVHTAVYFSAPLENVKLRIDMNNTYKFSSYIVPKFL